MTNALFRVDEAPRLETFFANLHECKDKSAHVHGLHPYPAKFIPHIPRALIRALAKDGDVLLDPMCGSGTALVEAAVEGHPAIGVDLNPIATLVSRAKTTPLQPEDELAIRRLAAEFESVAVRLRQNGAEASEELAGHLPVFHNRDKWFARQASQELAHAKAGITGLASVRSRDFAFCVLSSILVAVSNQESETRWCAKPREAPPGATLGKLAARLLNGLDRAAAYAEHRAAPAAVHLADARSLPLESASVGLVVTSPPYANSHDYYLYNKLRMFWLGYDVAPVQQQEIGSRNRHSDLKEEIGTYTTAMASVLNECRRVLRSDGAAAIVVADAVIRGELFDMGAIYTAIARETGFRLDSSYQFGHREFNASFQRGFGTTRNKRTHVLVFHAA